MRRFFRAMPLRRRFFIGKAIGTIIIFAILLLFFIFR